MQRCSNLVRLLFVVLLIMAITAPNLVQARVLRKYSMDVAPPAQNLDGDKGGDEIVTAQQLRLRALKMQQQRSDPEVNQEDIVLPMERRSLGSLWAMERYG